MNQEQERAKERIATELDRSRHRSNGLTLDALDDEGLHTQHSPLMSPLVWDLAHVGNYEEQWLLRAAGGKEALRPDIDGLYDAFENSRSERVSLPLLDPVEAYEYNARVRREVLDVLSDADLGPAEETGDERSLLDAGFIFHMVIQHEHMHDETMLATHQLRRGAPVLLEPARGVCSLKPPVHEEVYVPPGTFTMGTDDDPWSFDNERPARSEER